MIRFNPWRPLLLGIAALAGLPAADAQPVVTLASDEWCPYICTDNTQIVGGYLVELTALILEHQGKRLESILLPLNRAMSLSTQGSIDGIYAPAMDQRLAMSAVLATSRACFYTLPGQTWQYTGPASLQGQVIAAIDDYGYDAGRFDAYIAASKTAESSAIQFVYGKQPGRRLVRMLLSGRFPIAVEHETVMNHLLNLPEINARARVRNAGCLDTALPLVIGIGKQHADADALLKALNQGFAELQHSEQLARLRAKYNIAP